MSKAYEWLGVGGHKKLAKDIFENVKTYLDAQGGGSGGGASISPYTSNPAMNGEANAGTSSLYARGDHVHPTDTSRAAASHTHSVSDITSGTLPIARGGTGQTTAAGGLYSLMTPLSVLASSGLSDNDYIPVQDYDGNTAAKVSVSNLLAKAGSGGSSGSTVGLYSGTGESSKDLTFSTTGYSPTGILIFPNGLVGANNENLLYAAGVRQNDRSAVRSFLIGSQSEGALANPLISGSCACIWSTSSLTITLNQGLNISDEKYYWIIWG